MHRIRRRWALLALGSGTVVLALIGTWLCLTYRPPVYRKLTSRTVPRDIRQKQAKQFVAQSLQLRNDIANEPVWEATFTDEEVNAWLSEDLVTTFRDQIPPQVREPRFVFEDGCVILVFEVEQGIFRPVITIEGEAGVPEDNVLALRIRKVHAGLLPISARPYIERIAERIRPYALDLSWTIQHGQPLVLVRYTADPSRADVVLERVEVREGLLRLSGRSDRSKGVVVRPTLPNRRVLQTTFPIRSRQEAGAGVSALRIDSGGSSRTSWIGPGL